MYLYAKLDSRQKVSKFPFILQESLDSKTAQYNDMVLVSQENLPKYLDWKTEAYAKSVDDSGSVFKALYEVKTIINENSSFETKQNRLKTVLNNYKNLNYPTFKEKIKNIKQQYSTEEADTWNTQLSEALDYNKTGTEGPLLKSLSEQRNISIQELVSKILKKSDEYNYSYGTILGKYRKNEEILNSVDVNQESTWDNINKYNWNL